MSLSVIPFCKVIPSAEVPWMIRESPPSTIVTLPRALKSLSTVNSFPEVMTTFRAVSSTLSVAAMSTLPRATTFSCSPLSVALMYVPLLSADTIFVSPIILITFSSSSSTVSSIVPEPSPDASSLIVGLLTDNSLSSVALIELSMFLNSTAFGPAILSDASSPVRRNTSVEVKL